MHKLLHRSPLPKRSTKAPAIDTRNQLQRMELNCLASGSSGNCYILLADSGETLILECGINFAEIKKALDWGLGNVAGCLVSHQHRDHCKALPQVVKAGIPTYAIPEVYLSFEMTSWPFLHELFPGRNFKVGSFTVLALPVMHDVPCVSFVIHHPEMGKMLFITDTMYTKYRVKDLSHILIEANYCDEILNERIAAGLEIPSMKRRLLESHMEIKSTVKILSETDLDKVNEVVLIHISRRNGDFSAFRDEVGKVYTGEILNGADRLKINFNKNVY